MKDRHRTMLKKANNELGYVMCVIGPKFVKEFEAMGFVDHIDKLNKSDSKSKKSKKG